MAQSTQSEVVQALIKGSGLQKVIVDAILAEIEPEVSCQDSAHARLIRVICVMRAVDTFMTQLIHHCDPSKLPNTFREAIDLVRLKGGVANMGHLSPEQYSRFKPLVAARNQYMHQAGVAPANEQDVKVLLGEIYSLAGTMARLAG
jgi:hypothetical protein